MAHVRQQIRNAVVSAITGLTTTGSRVYRHRLYPLANANLPGLVVYTDEESTEYLTMGSNRTIQHTLSLKIEAYVKAVQDYDNILDQINVEISDALSADVTLGNLAKDTQITAFSAAGEADGEQPAYIGVFQVQVAYMTKEDDQETAV